ncbi:MAG: histidinol-phosphatase [Bacteroidota bacterium]
MTYTQMFLMIATTLFLLHCSPVEDSSSPQRWYKGNLHTHSYWSDGDEFPEQIMKWYKERAYHFVALSDHNRLAEGERWMVIPDGDMYQTAFQEYLQTFGEEWVEYKETAAQVEVRLKTLEEYRPLFEEKDSFLILQAEEITDQFEKRPIHLNATNVQELIDPQGGKSVVETIQNNIDAVHRQREKTGIPMIIHVNHPNFHYAISLEDMIQLRGERFFEVFNGHPQVHNLGDSVHMDTEEMWDLINIAYLKQGKPLMYGMATDDSHHYHEFDSKWSNSGRGWIMVNADSLQETALIDAMEKGKFYASTGVQLTELSVQNNKIHLKIDAEADVQYEIFFIGCEKGDKESKVLEQVSATEASFTIGEKLLFVRAKIVSSALHPNPIETAIYEMAWTQPATFQHL